ncbi:Uncharacterised protein [uncultured archaeon]|nr:Uncharacterised protein [uncultured archaeon]
MTGGITSLTSRRLDHGTPLVELNALLDNFIPLTQKISIAKASAMQKEAKALEKILARVRLVMPYLHENGEPGQCPLTNRDERIPTDQDSGLSVRNSLTLIEDGPRLIRYFTVEDGGQIPLPSRSMTNKT